MIDKLQRECNIDPNRIYANGMSNGGDMEIVLPYQLPDRIAAVGSVAGAKEHGRNHEEVRGDHILHMVFQEPGEKLGAAFVA